MNWRAVLQRGSLIFGLISLVFAGWGGTHLQHLLGGAGSRHTGEFLVAFILSLLVFAGSWYGARRTAKL